MGDYQLNEGRALAWSKVVAIRTLLEMGKRNIVWMDADALAFNPKSIREIIYYKFPISKSILFTNDFDEGYEEEASEGSSINCGVMIIRNTAWSKQFWKSVWGDFPTSIQDGWWEQRAVLMFRQAHPKEFAENTHIIPHRYMNTWQEEHKTGDFIVHAAGRQEGKYDTLLQMYCEHTHLGSCNKTNDQNPGQKK